MVAPSAWERYLRWNGAICATVFTEEQSGRPVYLDMDDDVLDKVAVHLPFSVENARADLARTVRTTLSFSSPAQVFRKHLDELRRWRADSSSDTVGHQYEPPPVVALLAVFTLAAEDMGGDSGNSPNDYYTPLFSILGVTAEEEKGRLTKAYRDDAERLWQGLNDWLTRTDGRHGIPTAFSLTHRYIGLPLSQALVRTADRRHLTQMFAELGLSPGIDMPPTEMRALLDEWIQPYNVTNNLWRLWQQDSAKDRIAEVAATELLSWDATVVDQHSTRSGVVGRVRLTAELQTFLKPRLQLSFLATLPGGAKPDKLSVTSAHGSPTVDVVPLAGATVLPRSIASIEPKSLVEGVLRLIDPCTGAVTQRRPRRVVLFRRDDLVSALVECDRAQLSEDLLLLIKKDAKLVEETKKLLDDIARPGYKVREELAGLPSGWLLVSGVQILSLPSANPPTDLNVLLPTATSQLAVASGLRLPGRLRTWSSLHPPEIRAVSQVTGDLRLTLLRTGLDALEATEQCEWTSTGTPLLVDLTEHALADGDYELRLEQGKKALQRSMLRLRSSDTPDRWSWENSPPLHYEIGHPLGALFATRAESQSSPGVRGALISSAQISYDTGGTSQVKPAWWSAGASEELAITQIAVSAPAPRSCVVTGAHHLDLPTVLHGRRGLTIQGTCRECGLVKRYPTVWRGGRAPFAREIADRSWLTHLGPADETDVDRDEALDALIYLGGGPASTLTRVASQLGFDAMNRYRFRHDLEALGHLDLSRNDLFDVTEWAVAPPCLAETVDDRFLLCGAWSDRAWRELDSGVQKVGGSISYDDNRGDGPTSSFVTGMTANAVGELLDNLDLSRMLPGDQGPTIVKDAALSLVTQLPSLSAVEQTMPRVPLPGAGTTQRFNVANTAWQHARTALVPGAYRLASSFHVRNVYLTEADAARSECVVGTAPLVKHLEAARVGRPLVGYEPSSLELTVPMGADLPGLYGRAAVLSSGRLPSIDRRSRRLVYHGVPAKLASLLHHLLAT